MAVSYTHLDVYKRQTFIDGNKHKVLHDPQSMVITKNLAEKYFNTTSAAGKSLNINFEGEFQNFTVTGVIENPPVNSSMQAEMLIPIHKSKNKDNHWINFYPVSYTHLDVYKRQPFYNDQT